jgi:hypothetical protein
MTSTLRYVATTIMSPAVQEYCRNKGIIFVEAADAASGMIKVASDPSINGDKNILSLPFGSAFGSVNTT